MQPYETPFYFVLLGVALVPLVIAHLYQKKWMPYQVVVSIGFLWLTFGGSMTLWPLLGFGLVETLIVKAYEHYRTREQSQNKTWVFVLALLLAILQLFIVKATPLFSNRPSILGFLGISYVTFKTVAAIIELRDGLIKSISVKEFVYFLYFFPTISSGPIDRFRRFQKELAAPVTEKYQELLNKGIFNIFLGFLYNFIIGYEIDNLLLHRFAIQATTHPGFWNMVIAMYAYGFYLFFNFAGYSLMAIGVSNLMGYDIPINFKKPFLSKNIHDFWNRWHITLSFWFRDFVYMRLVKWFITKKKFKSTVTMANVAYVLNMGLMGFWHGFTWYYVLYGLYHAGLMIGYDAWLRTKRKHKWKIPDNKFSRFVGIFITVNLVFISFLIFSGIPNFAIMHWLNPHSVLPNF